MRIVRNEYNTYINGAMDIKHTPIIDKYYQLVLTDNAIYIWNLSTDNYTLWKGGNVNDIDLQIAYKYFTKERR